MDDIPIVAMNAGNCSFTTRKVLRQPMQIATPTVIRMLTIQGSGVF